VGLLYRRCEATRFRECACDFHARRSPASSGTRGAGKAFPLRDVCPHRAFPASRATVTEKRLNHVPTAGDLTHTRASAARFLPSRRITKLQCDRIFAGSLRRSRQCYYISRNAGRLPAKMHRHWSLESDVMEGISRHWPCVRQIASRGTCFNRFSSQWPAESGNARCGQTSRSANALPAPSRPELAGLRAAWKSQAHSPESRRFASPVPEPHSSSPSVLDAVSPGWIETDSYSCAVGAYDIRSLVLGNAMRVAWQGTVPRIGIIGTGKMANGISKT